MNTHSITYPLSSFLINAQGNLGLYHLLNLLQDAASSHAQLLGLGAEYMEQQKMFWVLTRQRLEMKRWPKWLDVLTIKTWIREGQGATSNRDFEIYLGKELLGECTTSWLALSSENRRPVAFDRSSIMAQHASKERVSLETRKIPPFEGASSLATFRVRNSDIDQNMHVNNTKYAQWVLDAVDFKDHFDYRLEAYEVNFLAETHLNDEITIEVASIDESQKRFQGKRSSDHKIVFTSLLQYVKLA